MAISDEFTLLRCRFHFSSLGSSPSIAFIFLHFSLPILNTVPYSLRYSNPFYLLIFLYSFYPFFFLIFPPFFLSSFIYYYVNRSIADCFKEAHESYADIPEVATQIRKGAALCRQQLMESTKMLRKVRNI